MIPQSLKKDMAQFHKDVTTKPNETVTMTLTGRKGRYVGHSIRYDRLVPKEEESRKSIDNVD